MTRTRILARKILTLFTAALYLGFFGYSYAMDEAKKADDVAKIQTQQAVNLSMLKGLWYNHSDHGCSTMNITTLSGTEVFTGHYANGKSGWCAKPGEWFPLTGALDQHNELTFTVIWKNPSIDCQANTVWNGHLIYTANDPQDQPSITTNWLLTSDSDGKQYQGTAHFTRQCRCSSCPSPLSQ